MRRRTRKCTLCGIYMTGKPNHPNSKHLDHIVPICQGGTHTHGNVRIICATCNLHRPKDGSDLAGRQLTLWAQGEIPVRRPRKNRCNETGLCGKGLHPWTADNIGTYISGQRYCRQCRQCGAQKRSASNGSRTGGLLQQCRCGQMFAAPGRTFMCPDCTTATAHRAAELHASGMTWASVAAAVGYKTAEGARYAAKRIGYPRPSLRDARRRLTRQ